MRNRNELKKSDNDIFQIKGILEKSSDNKWIQDFVYWLRKFFYMEYWQGEKKDERYAVQMIQLLLKEYLDFLGKGDTAVEEVLRKFEMMLPFLQRLVISDMKAAYEGDPAAESYMEIIAAYPGPLAVLIQRTANCLYKLKVPILPRIMTEYAHSMTGIDIHPGAEIGESFFIDHGTGVVIGETTVIGDYVKIYQGVTLGALSTRGGHKQKSMKRHPTVEDNVTIYAGATVLGGNTVIGRGTVIGGNAWVTHSIPAYTKIFSDIVEMKSQKLSGGK
ncbi:MAG: serine O-acetyltransferase EpsC [Lachnospiraceae bacterium]|nr:serine O-acetyltransferase EpsC [Lachnospiraceae bacterium]MDU2033347.1 serine O-acetyltransferase EpsC [Lachnospiraceae bacterium]